MLLFRNRNRDSISNLVGLEMQTEPREWRSFELLCISVSILEDEFQRAFLPFKEQLCHGRGL
jgi:hypothetical protein